MPSTYAFSPHYLIYPLTLLQMYQAARKSNGLSHDLEGISRNRIDGSPVATNLAARAFRPLYFHLTTSAYGIFVKDQLAGWMSLRGWNQLLYVESLVVLPEFFDQGIENALLNFGENTARELRRAWLALTVPMENGAISETYESQGYLKGHWRVLRSKQSVPESSNGHVTLKRAIGSAAKRAYRQFAEQDLQASDPDTAGVQSRFLMHDPYYSRLGQNWVIETQGRQVGFLHTHGPTSHPTMMLATGPESWGSPQLLSIVKQALGEMTPEILDIRFGSDRHHDAARAVLEPFGFFDHPANAVRMFKRIESEEST